MGNNGEAYTNKPFATLKGELEYVLIDGFGTPEDWAAINDFACVVFSVLGRNGVSF